MTTVVYCLDSHRHRSSSSIKQPLTQAIFTALKPNDTNTFIVGKLAFGHLYKTAKPLPYRNGFASYLSYIR